MNGWIHMFPVRLLHFVWKQGSGVLSSMVKEHALRKVIQES